MRNRQKPRENEQASYDHGQRCELSHRALAPAFFVVAHLRARAKLLTIHFHFVRRYESRFAAEDIYA